MEKENPEYVVWFILYTGRPVSVLSIYKKGVPPLRSDACIYRVKAEEAVIRKTYNPLISIMQLAGETLKSGDVRCELDRESILAVVPEWEKVL